MENTAVQELINELEQFKKFPMVDQATITSAIDFAKLRLEKEKEQIKDAYMAAICNVYELEVCPADEQDAAEEFYNENYQGVSV